MTSRLVKSLFVSIVDLLFQLEQAEEDSVNPDFAVAIMESVGAELQSLDADDLNELILILKAEASAETNLNRKMYFDNFAENFGLI